MSKFCGLNFTVSCFWIHSKHMSRSSSEWVLPRAVKQSLSNTSRKSMESEVYNIGLLLLLLLLLLLQSCNISTTALVGLVTTRQSLQQSCSCLQHNPFTHTHTHSLSLVSWDLNVSFFLSFFLSFLSLFSLLSFLPSGLMVFGLVLKPEISYRVDGFWFLTEDFLKTMFLHGEIFEFLQFFFCPQDTFSCKWQGHSVTHTPCSFNHKDYF
jgi:hypothetical protein